MFSTNMWKDKDSTTTFLKFIANLRRKTIEDIKDTTSTHKFIRALRDGGRLVRCYTQNIDGLEAREGLVTDMARGKGHRSRFSPRIIASPVPAMVEPGSEFDGGCECVQLHGDLQSLRCSVCANVLPWTEEYSAYLDSGNAPPCQTCQDKNEHRESKGRRSLPAGLLVPNIVLYGEDHPQSGHLGPISESDIRLRPDALVIMGTSLKVHGLKILVKELARSIHSKKTGTVIFVNNTRPSDSVWGDVIDYWVEQDCDGWVEDLKVRCPGIWSRAPEIQDVTETSSSTESTPLNTGTKTSPLLAKLEMPRPGSATESKALATGTTTPTSTSSTRSCSSDPRMSIEFVLNHENASISQMETPSKPENHTLKRGRGGTSTLPKRKKRLDGAGAMKMKVEKVAVAA